MRITFANDVLFTAGRDGNLIIFDIKNRDNKSGLAIKREFGTQPPFSHEILVEKSEMEELESQRDTFDNENAAANETHNGVNDKMGTGQQENEITKLQEELISQKTSAVGKLEVLYTTIKEFKKSYALQIKQQEEQQHEELEAKRNEYSQKMLEDAARYQELQT